MKLPNSSLFVEFSTKDNNLYFYDKDKLLLVAWLDINSNIIALDIFKNGCIVSHLHSDNDLIRYELLSINKNEVVIKCLNRYHKTIKVRFN